MNFGQKTNDQAEAEENLPSRMHQCTHKQPLIQIIGCKSSKSHSRSAKNNGSIATWRLLDFHNILQSVLQINTVDILVADVAPLKLLIAKEDRTCSAWRLATIFGMHSLI